MWIMWIVWVSFEKEVEKMSKIKGNDRKYKERG